MLLGAFVSLAVAAAISEGSLLRTWDEPVQRAVEGARTPWLNTVVRTISQLGGTQAAVIGLVILLSLVWRRCRSLAVVLLLATLARPLIEWTLKALIDRPRPNFQRLVEGDGPSFPSGHPMAAVALWGLLPPVVALFTRKRRLWWWSVAVSVSIIVLVSMSRIYLGVHWLSDVVGALLLGSLYLLVVQWLLDWHHERMPCRAFVADGRDLHEDFKPLGPRVKRVKEASARPV